MTSAENLKQCKEKDKFTIGFHFSNILLEFREETEVKKYAPLSGGLPFKWGRQIHAEFTLKHVIVPTNAGANEIALKPV